MDITFSQPVLTHTKPFVVVATFEDWRRALRGVRADVGEVSPAVLVMPAELPPLPASEARASFEQVRRLLAQGLSEPILAQEPSDEAAFQDKFALWNEAPSRIELFLSRYHNQTFAAFAVVAVVLLWMM